jgi:hypothetical protein
MNNIKKNCSKCNISKELNDFHINKYGKYGVHSQCKECKNLYKKNYREINKELLKNKFEEYSFKNKEKIKKYKQNYYQKNKKKINERVKKYNHKNKHLKCWRDLIYMTLKKLGGKKEGKTIDVLGYSAIELKKHIEKQLTEGMSWANHGEWHIDHIKPIITFNKNTNPKIVNKLSNLRPMWATTRTISGVTYEGNLNRKKNNRRL